MERAGQTAVLIGWDSLLRGAVAVGDAIKPSAAAAVAGLRRLGLRPVLLMDAGDGPGGRRGAVGIEEVIALYLRREGRQSATCRPAGTGWRWSATG